MTNETTRRLLDALDACATIRQYTAGMDADAFAEDPVLRDAVVYRLVVLGEALNRLAQSDPTVVEAVPELRRIVGLRNRVVHAYDNVDDEIVWDIVQTKLVVLRQQLDRLADGT